MSLSSWLLGWGLRQFAWHILVLPSWCQQKTQDLPLYFTSSMWTSIWRWTWRNIIATILMTPSHVGASPRLINTYILLGFVWLLLLQPNLPTMITSRCFAPCHTCSQLFEGVYYFISFHDMAKSLIFWPCSQPLFKICFCLYYLIIIEFNLFIVDWYLPWI